MSHDSPEELISAYVDGQLSADEQRHAEQLLTEQPELRQLYEELRALGGQLKSLPRRTLPKDFGEQVLRRVEQSRLDGDRPAAGTPEPANSAAVNPAAAGQAALESTGGSPGEPAVELAAPTDPFWTRRRILRAIVWPSIAVAAAVAMTVFNPESRKAEKQRSLARAPAGEHRDAADSKDAQYAKRQPRAEIGAAPERSAGEAQLEGATADQLTAEENADSAAAVDHLKQRQLPAAAPRAAIAGDAASGVAQPADAEPRSRIRFDNERGNEQATDSPNAVTEGIEADSVAQGLRAAAPPASHLTANSDDISGLDTFTIDVELTATAARDEAFEKLLERNHLVQVAGDEQQEDADLDEARFAGAERSEARKAKNAPVQNEPVLPQRAARGVAAELAAPEAGPQQIIEVDATVEQFVATLQDLQKNPDQFTAVDLLSNREAEASRDLPQRGLRKAGQAKGQSVENGQTLADALSSDKESAAAPAGASAADEHAGASERRSANRAAKRRDKTFGVQGSLREGADRNAQSPAEGAAPQDGAPLARPSAAGEPAASGPAGLGGLRFRANRGDAKQEKQESFRADEAAKALPPGVPAGGNRKLKLFFNVYVAPPSETGSSDAATADVAAPPAAPASKAASGERGRGAKGR